MDGNFNKRPVNTKMNDLEVMALAITGEAASMPCPIVHNAREHRMKICMEDLGTAPRKGYSAVDRRYYIGYKLHLLMSMQGIFHDMAVTPANVHDIKFLKERQYDGSEEREIIGDRG
ncbi:hypothetical protein BST97_03675 [Nonlabens spongiae]|uniref:Transposase IS4-like domain-containing protein n=1 Tax=Nonlabens spongiae TaxID=331648 RepID=A0A1W6MI71_9FLAO|nr:transposase [Nonlabens spongiae]ARN77159.1 hypothetical protein BST97_03675 [Nonlabens spongiae]